MTVVIILSMVNPIRGCVNVNNPYDTTTRLYDWNANKGFKLADPVIFIF